MEFAIKNEFAGFAKLIPGTAEYLQAMPENNLYFIQDTRSSNERLPSYYQNKPKYLYLQFFPIHSIFKGCVLMTETKIAKRAS